MSDPEDEAGFEFNVQGNNNTNNIGIGSPDLYDEFEGSENEDNDNDNNNDNDNDYYNLGDDEVRNLKVLKGALRAIESTAVDFRSSTHIHRIIKWPRKPFLKTRRAAPKITESTELKDLKTGRMIVKDVCEKNFQHLKKVLPKHILDETSNIIDETLESLIAESMIVMNDLNSLSINEYFFATKYQNYVYDAAIRLGIPQEVIERTKSVMDTLQEATCTTETVDNVDKEEEKEEAKGKKKEKGKKKDETKKNKPEKKRKKSSTPSEEETSN